jgi:hypothetical protein
LRSPSAPRSVSERNVGRAVRRRGVDARRAPPARMRQALRAGCITRICVTEPSEASPPAVTLVPVATHWVAIMADVHTCWEADVRLVACLTMCLMPILANAAQTDNQAPSTPQAYCVNGSAEFYPYTGDPCKSGYQLGSGNCRKTDGRTVAVPREQCVAMGGIIELPFEHGIAPRRR